MTLSFNILKQIQSISIIRICSKALPLVAAFAVFAAPFTAKAGELPIIDAHSQLPAGDMADKVVRLMDEAGVAKTILSFRGSARGKDVLEIYNAYPGRIIPAIKTKGNNYIRNSKKFHKQIEKQLARPEFAAMGEVLLWHAAKGNKAPQITVEPDDERVTYLLNIAKKRGWPFTIHIEFAAAGSDAESYMEKMEALLRDNEDYPILLIHMGQLGPKEVSRLLKKHKNLHFITSHSNPIVIAESGQPWINLFDGDSLKKEWKTLMTAYPDQFVLGFDNVWPEHWGDFYLDQVKLWRKALSELPDDVARKIAYRNAERLWNLPPQDTE